MSTMQAVPAIKCGSCKKYHSSVDEVRECCTGRVVVPPQVPAATVAQKLLPAPLEPPTARDYRGRGFATLAQLQYIFDLGGDWRQIVNRTYRGASHEIERLKALNKGTQVNVTVNNSIENAPNRRQTKIPQVFLDELADGYYAARQSSDHAYTFFKVSRPTAKNSKFKGCTLIKTQHGPEYNDMLTIWPSGQISVYNFAVEDDLLLVAVDQVTAALAYAKELGRCCRCNTELTDERSRWYGIGPDCEKVWPKIITQVDETKGPFKFGQS